MKNYFKSTIAGLFVSSLLFTGCLDLTSNATDADASVNKSVSQSMNTELLTMPCDFDDRNTTQRVERKVGVIMLLPGSQTDDQNGGVYMISVPDEGRRFVACNMPDALKRENIKVTFSGEEKEVYEYEKWAAHPFKLSEVTVMQ